MSIHIHQYSPFLFFVWIARSGSNSLIFQKVAFSIPFPLLSSSILVSPILYILFLIRFLHPCRSVTSIWTISCHLNPKLPRPLLSPFYAYIFHFWRQLDCSTEPYYSVVETTFLKPWSKNGCQRNFFNKSIFRDIILYKPDKSISVSITSPNASFQRWPPNSRNNLRAGSIKNHVFPFSLSTVRAARDHCLTSKIYTTNVTFIPTHTFTPQEFLSYTRYPLLKDSWTLEKPTRIKLRVKQSISVWRVYTSIRMLRRSRASARQLPFPYYA